MSNTSTSPRITIRHLDIYPYNISELYNDVNNLVDTRTIYEDGTQTSVLQHDRDSQAF